MNGLVLCLGSTSLLSASAILRSTDYLDSVDVFVCLPNLNSRIAVEEIARTLPNVGTVIVRAEQQAAALHTPSRMFARRAVQAVAAPMLRYAAVKRFRELFFGKSYDQIYYAHDITYARILSLAAHSWPKAERICYGDGFGIFYANHRVYHLLGLPYNSHGFLEDFTADRRMGLLPMDCTCEADTSVPLEVVPKKFMLKAISAVTSAVPVLHETARALLAMHACSAKSLLLTENHAEIGCISFEDDVKMYCDIILNYTNQDSVVFLKSHPGENFPRNEAISNALKNERICISLPDALRFYPIELLSPLIEASNPILCCSYPRLTLSWLYGKEVINPMASVEFLHKWFPETAWRSYEDAIRTYEEPVRLLHEWNGEGMLWRQLAR